MPIKGDIVFGGNNMVFEDFKKAYNSIWKTSMSNNPNMEFDCICNPIHITKTNKELSDSVLYVIWWFMENGFSGKLTVNNTSKTEFIVNKEGVEDTFTLTSANQNPNRCDIKQYMELFAKSFSMLQEIKRMKSELESK